MKVTAAVLDQVGSEFTLKTLDLADPGPGEVLIEVAGVGVCHTDLAVQHGHLPFPFPAVLGHEGSGVVKSVGPGVTKVAPGDRVGATFNSCNACSECTAGSPSYCVRFMELNFAGVGSRGTATLRRNYDDLRVGGGIKRVVRDDLQSIGIHRLQGVGDGVGVEWHDHIVPLRVMLRFTGGGEHDIAEYLPGASNVHNVRAFRDDECHVDLTRCRRFQGLDLECGSRPVRFLDVTRESHLPDAPYDRYRNAKGLI